LKNEKYGEGPDFSRKYTTAVRAVVGRVSDGVRTTVRTDTLMMRGSLSNKEEIARGIFMAHFPLLLRLLCFWVYGGKLGLGKKTIFVLENQRSQGILKASFDGRHPVCRYLAQPTVSFSGWIFQVLFYDSSPS